MKKQDLKTKYNLTKGGPRTGASEAPTMKGYFAIGVDRLSKAHNMGNLLRTSYAFGASYFFTINATYSKKELRESDTSGATSSLPVYDYDSVDDFNIPHRAKLVGVELTDDAIDLPNFKHPRQAIYILGPEGGNLDQRLLEKCDYTIKIPMRFCVNVGVAGAIVMYDRLRLLGSTQNAGRFES